MSTIEANSVLDEIRRLHDSGQSGILTLTSSTGERVEVFLREGMIAAASSNIESHRLGDYLMKLGKLQARDLDSAQSEAERKKISFGEAIVRRKLMAQPELGETVRKQAVDLLEYAFKNGFSVDSFTNSLRAYYAPAGIGFPQLFLEMCRAVADPFETSSDSRIVLADRTDLPSFPWHPQELSVLSELQTPNTFESLLAATRMPAASLRQILGILGKLGVIDVLTSDSLAEESLMASAALLRNSPFPFEQFIPVIANPVLDEKLQIARNEFSFITEQFKSLKVQIRQADSESPLKVLAVSSPETQDGKSLIGTNLAFSFSMDPGRRVIIVDCDLRSPSLQQYLGVTQEPGLLQYLAEGNPNPYCYVRRVENLYFMTTGGIAPNPIEILSMHKMRQLIERLKNDFDTVILDSPPYCPIADARIVTALSDALILVLRRGRTSYEGTELALKSIDRKKLLGIVFNDVQPMLFHTYQSFGYYTYGSKQQTDSLKEGAPGRLRKYLKS